MTEGNRHKEIDRAKFLLILCVILIHSNLTGDLPTELPWFPRDVMCLMSRYIADAAVPAFMIISGFLFFKGIQVFNRSTYLRKLRSRAITLVLPYLLWNLIAALLLMIKVKWLGFNGYDVIDQNGFHPLNFIYGFWNFNSGYPYDFVLWFIRNLLIFVLLSPLIYLLAGSTLLTGLILVCQIISGNDFFLATYFLLGSWIALHPTIRIWRIDDKSWIISSLLWVATAMLLFIPDLPEIATNIIILTRNISATIAVISFNSNLISLPVPNPEATFFIYAFHGLFCTIARKASVSIFYDSSSFSILCAYAITFTILLGGSYIAFLLMRKAFPSVTRMLCGGR